MRIVVIWTSCFLFTVILLLNIRSASAQLGLDVQTDLFVQEGTAEGYAGYESTLTTNKSLQRAIGRIINYTAGLIGTLLLVLIVYGAYEWMTADGNDDQITKAKDTIKRAIIGAAILLAAYAITSVVVQMTLYSTNTTAVRNDASWSEWLGF